MAAGQRRSHEAPRRRQQPAPSVPGGDPTLYPVIGLVGAVLLGLYVMRLSTSLITHPADHAIGYLFWGVVLAGSSVVAYTLESRSDASVIEHRVAVLLVLLAFVAVLGLLFETVAASEPLHIQNMPDRMFTI